MRVTKAAACLGLTIGLASAQQPGTQKDNKHPSLTTSTCDADGTCTAAQKEIALDSNWMWVHKTGTYQPNCFDNNVWNAAMCPDPVTCAKDCAIDLAGADYGPVYGATAKGAALDLQFATLDPASGAVNNVGSRSYLLDNETHYTMFRLKNREFTFDVDVSQLPCGLNGALYFVEMSSDGGLAQYGGNNAGAKYGTGYCDAQCPHDIKFINGEANSLNWTEGRGALGQYGSCCTEMDIWEANSVATAVTPHACTVAGQTRCETAAECAAMCDTAGCDLNPYRNGNTTFFGPGAAFTVDSTKPMTVVTQFLTTDGTDAGELSEIRRVYVQGGVTIPSPRATLGGASFDSITPEFCAAKVKAFDEVDGFTPRGGLKAMGEALDRGMVLVMSLWDDGAAHMKWLDSSYPPTKDPAAPGVARGSCATTAGDPADLEKNDPLATVKYANIKTGPIGSTFPPVGPSPAPPPPPTPAPAGTCTGCGYNCHGNCASCGLCNMKPGCQSETRYDTQLAPPLSRCPRHRSYRNAHPPLLLPPRSCMGNCNGGNNAMWCGGGSTPTPAPATPTPAPTTPTPAPAPSGCPGGSLIACINLCPSDPPAAYQACVEDCTKRCT